MNLTVLFKSNEEAQILSYVKAQPVGSFFFGKEAIIQGDAPYSEELEHTLHLIQWPFMDVVKFCETFDVKLLNETNRVGDFDYVLDYTKIPLTWKKY